MMSLKRHTRVEPSLDMSKEDTLNHLRDIAGQPIKKGDIIAYVSNGSRGPGLKVGKVLSVSTIAGKLIVWGIDDDLPTLTPPGLSKTQTTLQSTNRMAVLGPENIRQDYKNLLAGVTLGEEDLGPRPKKEPVGKYLSLVPPPDYRRRN